MTLQDFIAKFGKFPSYPVAMHLADRSHIPNGHHNLDAGEFGVDSNLQKEIFYDVTQFSGVTSNTGIQRVVNAFLEKPFGVIPVFFYKNNYYRFKGSKIERSKRFIYLSRLFGFLGKFAPTVISKADFRLVNFLKFFRQSLVLSSLNVDFSNPISLNEINRSNIFIVDLPATREHLEFLHVINDFTNSKLSIFIHDLIPITHPELMPKNSTREFNLYAKLLLKVDKLITSSQYVATSYKNYKSCFPEINIDQQISIKKFPLFLKFDVPTSLQTTVTNYEHKLISGSDNFVLAVGTIFQRKNYSLVVRALELLEQKNIQCNFLIASRVNWGDEALNFAMVDQKSKKNKTIIVQDLDDQELRQFYEKASAVVFPSLAEGFGLPVIEARAFGKPVIVNTLEPMLSLSFEDTGVIAVQPNQQSWANAIEQILVSPIKTESLKNIDSKHSAILDMWCNDLLKIVLD